MKFDEYDAEDFGEFDDVAQVQHNIVTAISGLHTLNEELLELIKKSDPDSERVFVHLKKMRRYTRSVRRCDEDVHNLIRDMREGRIDKALWKCMIGAVS